MQMCVRDSRIKKNLIEPIDFLVSIIEELEGKIKINDCIKIRPMNQVVQILKENAPLPFNLLS